MGEVAFGYERVHAAAAVMKTTVTGAYPKISDGRAGQELRRALHRFDRGDLDQRQLEGVFNATTERAVREMEAAGVDVPNSGLIRWDDAFSPFTRVWRNVSGEALERYFDNNTYFRVPAVTGPIVVEGEATVSEYAFARSKATRRLKGTICGPLTFARLAEDRHFRDRERLARAVAAALREEIRALEAAGCDLIDVEEPGLARWPEDVSLARSIYGELSDGVRAELALYLPMFPADPVLERIADLPFAQVGLDLRSRTTGALDRISALPRTVVLGIVDARNTKLEDGDDLAREIEAAARRVSPERIWISPSTSLEYLPHAVVQAKLNVLVSAARTALAAGGAR